VDREKDFVTTDDENVERILAQAKFLRRECDGILPQRIWNIAADIEISIATLVTTAVNDASAWLSRLRGKLLPGIMSSGSLKGALASPLVLPARSAQAHVAWRTSVAGLCGPAERTGFCRLQLRPLWRERIRSP
jgi:hypothetical protein